MDLLDDDQIEVVVGEYLEEGQEFEQLVGLALQVFKRQLLIFIWRIELGVVDEAELVEDLDDHW